MGRPHEEFMKSSIGKVLTLISIRDERKMGKVPERQSEVHSMKGIPGF